METTTLYDYDNGIMLVYSGWNNGQIWSFNQFSYDTDAQDFSIKEDDRLLVCSEIKRLTNGVEFLKQF